MSENSLEQRVTDIIVEQLGVRSEQVPPEAKCSEDRGADSGEPVVWVMAGGVEFGSVLPETK